MDVRNIQEFVGKRAIDYAKWKDEQLAELRVLKKFKRDNECRVCFQPLLKSGNNNQDYEHYDMYLIFCCMCNLRMHEGCGNFSDSAGMFFCASCVTNLQKSKCPGCDISFEHRWEMMLGEQCSQCKTWYCDECRGVEEILPNTLAWGYICVTCWNEKE